MDENQYKRDKYLAQIAEDIRWIKWILIILFIYLILSNSL
ncbi:3-methyladenine DNA glycosylase AlkD [Salibacterium salarium]|nr:3-methyladenine DNA glycosylase AlkD [Salibacterium salarium]